MYLFTHSSRYLLWFLYYSSCMNSWLFYSTSYHGYSFLGYVLPWGQISFWGATVITSLFSAIPYVGSDIVFWLWGGFSVDNATLTRFFALHFLLPFVVGAMSVLHLFFFIGEGSGYKINIFIFAPTSFVKNLFLCFCFFKI